MKPERGHPIIDVWAQPAFADSLKKLPEVARLFKQSGSSPQLIHYLKTYGKDKVLFGTNFPQLSLEKCVQQVGEIGLSDEVAAKFLFQNARRVFNLAEG